MMPAIVISSSAATARPIAPPPPADQQPGAWTQYRGDYHLTSRSAITGGISEPAILWSHRLAGCESLIEVRPDRSETQRLTIAEGLSDPAAAARVRQQWSLNGALIDLDGNANRQPVPIVGNVKVGKMLAGVRGLQKFTCGSLAGFSHSFAKLEVRVNSAWKELWHKSVDTTIHTANPVIGDFDGDGSVEIAYTPWYYLTILDPATGEVKEKTRFIGDDEIPEGGGRAYGYFGAHDLDRDGKSEFVIICDFAKYISVLGREDGKLKRLWLQDITDPTKTKNPKYEITVRINPEPIGDIDADGRDELILSVYNMKQDKLWHVYVFDGITGRIKHDLAATYAVGMRDADGDGTPELFCVNTPNRGINLPDPGRIALVSLKNGRRVEIWRKNGSAFETYDVTSFPDNVNCVAIYGTRTVFCGHHESSRRPIFWTRRYLDECRQRSELTAWRIGESGRFEPVSAVTGPSLKALAISDSVGFAFRAVSFEGKNETIQTSRCSANVKLRELLPAVASQPVVGRLCPGTPPALVFETTNNTIEAFTVSPSLGPRVLWRKHGMAMTRWRTPVDGVLLADLDSDGGHEVIVNRYGKNGCARLAALDSAGNDVWYHDWPDVTGGHRDWNQSGVTYWQPGHFTHPRKMDILVQTCRAVSEGCLLDGETGRQVWFQDHTGDTRYFGGYWFRPFTDAATGLDDIHAAQIFYFVFDGATGKQTVALPGDSIFRGERNWASFPGTLVEDFLGSGDRQFLFPNWEGLALMRSNGEPVWATTDDWADWLAAAVAVDIDLDGAIEVVYPAQVYKDGVLERVEMRCRDGATGKLEWVFGPLESLCSQPAVCDINSDGRPECIYVIGENLYALAAGEDGRSGRIVWSFKLPAASPVPVAIADVYGTGDAQIVVMCHDGYVYGIGQRVGDENKRGDRR